MKFTICSDNKQRQSRRKLLALDPDFSARKNSILFFTGENVNYKPLPNTPQSCLPLKVL